ncbi:APC family permease [Methanogenium cariaci]|uniref:APC family permease n=1 Tax=Methanogenium cariaci TaxID=2197 RepID=UPI001FE158D1|nr:APC family permease [Methanogenium cariaci]
MPGGYLLFTVIALFATANTALLMMLASSRILYGMAQKQTLPAVIGYVHPGRRTPVVAIVGAALISMLFLLPGNIRDVALIANFTLFITFIVINAAVIRLRKTMPDTPRLPGAGNGRECARPRRSGGDRDLSLLPVPAGRKHPSHRDGAPSRCRRSGLDAVTQNSREG